MKILSKQRFDKIIDESIKLNKCKRCGHGGIGDIIVKLPWYGRVGASIKCRHCGYETKIYGISCTIFDDNRIGTPITYKSLMSGIKKAVAEWNSDKVGDN